VGGEVLENSWKVLRPGGSLITVVGDTPEKKAEEYGVKGFSILVEPNRQELVEIALLIDAGEVKPVVDAVFPLSQARRAFERGLSGHNRGKLVLTIEDDGNGQRVLRQGWFGQVNPSGNNNDVGSHSNLESR
jgi:NADPH:quinone reductase-like Zn-dependent oxidoreductase